jgi:cell division protein FtsB
MMQFGGPAFVIAIIAITMLAWVITTAIRAKHGYPLSDDCGNLVHRRDRDDAATKALVAENEQLKHTVGKLEERLRVLERIATDPSRQLADEIDKLR